MTFDSPAAWFYAICLTVPAVVIVTAIGGAACDVRDDPRCAWCWGLAALAALVGVESCANTRLAEGTPRWLGAAATWQP